MTKVCQYIATCPNGQERTFTYTSLKRLLSATNPESGTIGYTYDNNGNLLTRTDARSIVTTMAYDGLNRVTTKSYSDGVTPNVTYCYDGRTWTGTYAQCTGSRAAPFLGRLREEGSSASSTKFTNYDSLGHVMASAQTTGGTAYNFGYQYKLNDGLKQITYPSQRVVTYAYTGAGRVASMSGVLDGTTTNYTDPNTSISYFPHGGLNSLKLASQLVEQHCYNPRLQATGIRLGTSIATNCANSSDLLNIGLDFGTSQNNGNLQGQTIKRGSQTWSQTYTSCYDGVNRLTCASESGAGTWSQSYGYDNFGNRWVSDNTNLPSLSNQVPNGNWFSGNKVTNSPHGTWTYDNVGNLKAMSGMPGWGFDYDAENRQISAVTANSPTTTYKYDGEGRRISKTWNGQTTTFVYDAFGNLAAEYGGPVDSHGTHYLTSDHLGSTRLVTNSAGAAVKCYDYLPFGEEIGTTAGRPSCFGSGSYPVSGGASNTEFTAKERDSETGLDYFGARYMSSAQGRFTSPDPKGFSRRTIENPQKWNKYAYVLNNPLALVDPDGMEEVKIQFRAFIPPPSVGGFKGDNRTFSASANASSRVSVTVRVETDPQKNNGRPLIGSPDVKISPTHPTFMSGERTSTGPMLPTVSATQDKSGNVVVNVQENMRNPYTPIGGGIQSNLNFTVNQSATSATVNGTVSGSPAFEANFSVNGSDNQNVPLQNAPTGTIAFGLGLQQTNQINQTVQLKKKEEEERK